MPRRLEIRAPAAGADLPTVTLDSQTLSDHLRTTDRIDMPFTGVYLGDEPQYDLEVWVDGNLKDRTPPRSGAAEAVYEQLKSTPQPAGQPPAMMTLPPQEARERREAVKRELAVHPGRIADMEWKALHRMASVHEKNKAELLTILNRLGSDFMLAMEMVQNAHEPVVADLVGLELDQRLHNYVASTSSLIDQTRRVVKRYKGTSIASEYETRKNNVIKEPVVAFVRDLRNFLQHRSMPFLGHTVSFSNAEQSFTSAVQLSTAQLREWDGWSSTSKQYLDSNPEHIDLQAAISEQSATLDRVWSWLFAQYHGIHRADIVAVNELVGEHNWYLSGGAEGRPRRTWALIDFPYV